MPLFERKPRGMEPTAAGERLYEHARIILRAMAGGRARNQGRRQRHRRDISSAWRIPRQGDRRAP